MKKIKKFFDNNYILYVILLFAVISIYFKLPYGFFEQDEWHSFGNYLYLKTLSPLDFIKTLLTSGPLTHFTPLSTLTKMLMFNLFKLNAAPYFLISIFLHSIVSILVFKIILNITKNKWGAFLGSLFFATNASHFQAISWLGTFEGVELSTLFGLLGLNEFITNKGYLKIGIFLLLSLLFKEIGFIFLGLIIFLMIYEKSKLKNYFNIILVGLVYLLFKFSYIFLGTQSKPAVIASGVGEAGNTILYNTSVLIPKFLSTSIFSSNLLEIFSKSLLPRLEMYLPDVNSIWSVHRDMVYDLISFFIGLILFVLFSLILWKRYKKEYLISIFFIVFSVALIIPLKRYLIYPDSRYFYTATIGVSMILGVLVDRFKIVSIASILILIGLNIFYLCKNINTQVQTGIIRKNIIRQINEYLPSLSKKTVIFTESNKSYYGFSREIFPFQNGVGHTLLINYSLNQKIPIEIIKKDHFWDVNYQGYEKYDNFNFGYFYEIDKLKDEVKKGNISIDNIFAYSFVTPDNIVLDITDRVRNELKFENSNKREIYVSSSDIVSSINQNDINKILDKNRKTFWSTNLPYKISQYLMVDLGVLKNIVEIDLDSYDNKDQDSVGYLIITSQDSKSWDQVFRDDLRSPDDTGRVKIYLKPEPIRYIKIQQVGYHDFASWVIHELKIYEIKN